MKENLSTLCAAIISAGLSDTLKTIEEATLFAPINNAFENLDLSSCDLESLLLCHVTPIKLKMKDLECAGRLEMATSETTVTRCKKRKPFGQVGKGNESNKKPRFKQSAPIKASNGVIYTLSRVLLPGESDED